MVKARVITEESRPKLKVIDKVMEDISIKETEVENTDNKFNAQYNPDEGVVTFELTDGTPVSMKSPKTRQFLLLDSFMNNSAEEYKTEAFILLKLASLCINKFGTKVSISFDELVDSLEFKDVERLASAIAFFQDKFEHLSGSTVH